ncbi:MAG: ParB-like protein [Synechococcaceae cyanobacterium]|nr:ParB-like protein [Synechococcaceae cyanobacterium]
MTAAQDQHVLHLPPYQPLPPPGPKHSLHQIPVAQLQPTQLCIGLAEIRSRQSDFREETQEQRLRYLATKPVPMARSRSGELWMIDRHHRLRALVELVPDAVAYGYVALQLEHKDREAVLAELQARGWLYLHDGRGNGPLPASSLPSHLAELQDDPYRSLVWKLKKERLIDPEPLIPFHEFRWGAWLRSRSLPPFSSLSLEPALPAARALVRSRAAAHLAGWTGAR